MIVVDFPYLNNTDYASYMTRLKPESNKRNMFFDKWWQKTFDCQLPSAVIPNPPSKCSDQLSMERPTDTQTAMLALNAVYTMALGLSSAFTEICPGDPLNCKSKIRTESARYLIAKKIRETKLSLNGKEYSVYTERGDGKMSLKLMNVHKSNDMMEYVKVSHFSFTIEKFNS